MSFDPIDTTAVEQQREDRKSRDKQAARTEAEDVKWLMKSRQGRRIVWRLLDKTGVFKTSFTGNSETFFREGQRNIGLMWLAQVNELCPEQYSEMIKEQRDDRSNRSSTEHS